MLRLMNRELLNTAVAEIKQVMHLAITSASYKKRGAKCAKEYSSGLEAKTALIRSERLIQRIHEVTKKSIHDELKRRGIDPVIHPPLGANSPEMNVWGLLKKKKQDVVVLLGDAEPKPERIQEGPLKGQMDKLGIEATRHSIVLTVGSTPLKGSYLYLIL